MGVHKLNIDDGSWGEFSEYASYVEQDRIDCQAKEAA